MNATSLQRRLALLRLDLQARLGLSGLLGGALIGLAAGALWITPKFQDDASDLQKQIVETRTRLADPSAQVPVDAATQAARFREWFPLAAQSPEDVRTLFRVAAEHKISLARGDYSAALRREARLASYDVVLPVRAHYPAVRTFVIAALNALPHASLAELRLERGSSTADTVEARVHLTLYYRED
jgi:hypothetical protein